MLRLPKFGLRFSHEKLDALLRGDQSGTVLNRFFVCAAHAVGSLSSVTSGDDIRTMVLFHARRAQAAWECSIEVHEGNDYRVSIQVALMSAAISIFIRMTQTALLYIQKSYGAIEAGNMQFVPIYGRPPELSDDLRETLATLSQAIYWANYLFLMCGGSEPLPIAKLENEFRQELPVSDITSIPLYLSHTNRSPVAESLSYPIPDLSSDDADARPLTRPGHSPARWHPPY